MTLPGDREALRLRRLVPDGLIDLTVDGLASRVAHFLSQVAEQPGGPREQGKPAEQVRREPEVSQRGPADPRPVQRQRAANDGRMHAADRGEQLQVRAQYLRFGSDPEDHRRARITALMHWMPEPRNQPSRCPLRL